MAVATLTTILPRRLLRVAKTAARMGRLPGLLTPAERLALATLRERLLDSADACLTLADALDAPLMDMEPDAEGEAEPGEENAQPATLAPFIRPARIIRATAAEQRAAYLATGSRLPRNLRPGLLGRIGL